jgi:hypothetical protein
MLANYNGSQVAARNGSQNTPAPAASTSSGGAAGAVRGGSGGAVVNWSFLLVFAATNVPQPIPGYLVPDGASVRVRANNGGAGNAQAVFVANNPDVLRANLGTPLLPLDDVAFPVRNTAHVWAMGKAGDGVIVAVSSNSNS